MEEGRKHCIKDAVEKFKLWRGSCGRSGWYDMDDASLFIFFESIYPPIEPKPLPNGLPDVKRYDIEGGSGYNQGLAWGVENSTGEYVKYSDYEHMRSLAEKEMIGFAEWIGERGYTLGEGNRWFYGLSIGNNIKGSTTSELLIKYRESCR